MPIIGGGNATGPGELVAQEVTFTEVANTGGTYTATVTVPPLSWIFDIRVYGAVLWDSVTSATLKVGDGVDDDGWYIGISVKATDLAAGEVLTFQSAGGKPGAYLNLTDGLRTKCWSTLERVIQGKITEVTTTGHTNGRTRMMVLYTTQANATVAPFVP